MYSVTVDQGSRQITVRVEAGQNPTKPPVIYVAPSADFGDFSKYRNSSNYQDYMDLLISENLSLTFPDNRIVSITKSLGKNYSTGIPIKLDDSTQAATTIGSEPVVISYNYIGNAPLRISIEVE